MTTTVYVPGDAGALSLGAEATAQAIAATAAGRGCDIALVRNGSRGLYWLEPLVEVVTPAGRVAYGPVTAADVPGLFDAGFQDGGRHPLGQGPTGQIPWLASQQRIACARIGVIAPTDVADYAAHGGLAGLRRALELSPEQIVREATDSGLRGRGGAAFPTGRKWQTALAQPGTPKYIAANADEGDSGTFADRLLLEGDPLAVIEGMVIAGLAVGATRGYLYLRIEYPHARRVLGAALAAARAAGMLGADLLGSGRSFDLEVRLGAGAYICGEETSMLESLEGRRGEVRVRPPLPAVQGLFGRPTVVNNIVTLASVPAILAHGAGWYRAHGSGESRGTMPLQLAGNVRRGGLIERAFGVSLRELVEDYGGGTASGRPLRAVQVGGPLGAWLPPALLDTAVDYEALAALGAPLGHGGLVLFDDTVDLARMARFAFEFCAGESCGKCTPCRIGSTRGVELLDRIIAGRAGAADFERLARLCTTLRQASLCGLGGLTPNPVESALRHFPADFHARR